MVKKICDCHWFRKNTEALGSFITLGWSSEMKYHGPPFEYCPWCGAKLKQEVVN